MHYFEQSDDKFDRIGKVIGDTFVTILIAVLAVIIVHSFIFR